MHHLRVLAPPAHWWRRPHSERPLPHRPQCRRRRSEPSSQHGCIRPRTGQPKGEPHMHPRARLPAPTAPAARDFSVRCSASCLPTALTTDVCPGH